MVLVIRQGPGVGVIAPAQVTEHRRRVQQVRWVPRPRKGVWQPFVSSVVLVPRLHGGKTGGIAPTQVTERQRRVQQVGATPVMGADSPRFGCGKVGGIAPAQVTVRRRRVQQWVPRPGRRADSPSPRVWS